MFKNHNIPELNHYNYNLRNYFLCVVNETQKKSLTVSRTASVIAMFISISISVSVIGCTSNNNNISFTSKKQQLQKMSTTTEIKLNPCST